MDLRKSQHRPSENCARVKKEDSIVELFGPFVKIVTVVLSLVTLDTLKLASQNYKLFI